jgi:dihydrofolate reductase
VLLAGGASLASALAPFPAAARATAAADLRTVVYVGLTIDGFLARPDGALDFLPTPSDPSEDFGFADFLASVDVVVMGRKTFDQVAAFVAEGVPWPYAGKPVYVVSRTMRQEDVPLEALAAARASGEGVSEKISPIIVSASSPAETLRVVAQSSLVSSRRNKNTPRAPLRAYVDGGSVIRALLEEDLVDEMVLTTVPVLIGRGAPLFGFDARDGKDRSWDVAASTKYENDGLVKTRYVRRRR